MEIVNHATAFSDNARIPILLEIAMLSVGKIVNVVPVFALLANADELVKFCLVAT